MDFLPAPHLEKTTTPIAEMGILTVDLAAIQRNYRLICDRAVTAEVAAVIKADAYGLGAYCISQSLLNAGCKSFFVAHLLEALELRHLLPHWIALNVLNGIPRGAEAVAMEQNITPVLNSVAHAEALATAAHQARVVAHAVVHVDTGMSRLGLTFSDLMALQRNTAFSQWVSVDLLMSHLACADSPADPINREQYLRFDQAASLFPGVPRSLAATDGIYIGDEYVHEMVRPGIGLYIGSSNGDGLKSAVALEIPVLQTREISSDTTVGYGCAYVADKPMRLATLGAGYADGIPRSLSNVGVFHFKDKPLPVVGRVSMDSIVVDASALPHGYLREGDMVEVFGRSQPVEKLATAAGTISYELLVRLGRRYIRRYV